MSTPSLPCKAVLFDLDGTLLDTAADLVEANNQTLEHFGYKRVDPALIRTQVTSGMRAMLRTGIPEDQWTTADIDGEMRSYFAQYYTSHICDLTTPFPGIIELLSDLHERGVKLAVITNKYEDMAFALLQKFPFYKDLSLILGCDSIEHSKPHPEPILKTLDSLGIAPYEAIYVGDHINDIWAANRARTPSAAALWGYGGNECGDPLTWPARFFLKDVYALRDLVGIDKDPQQRSSHDE